MKPVFAAWPAKKRTALFPAFAGGIWLLTFLVVAFGLQNLFLALLLPPALAIGGAWAAVGWPEIRRKDGKPFVEPQVKPYLFFVLAPIFAFILYPILGLALTQVSILPVKWDAIPSIVLSIAGAAGAAYLLVGFPDLVGSAKRQYAQIPPERRPFLFFPISVVLFLVLYLSLGVATTKLVGDIAADDPTGLLNIQVLVLVPLCLLIACVIAHLLVGVPRPRQMPELPKVTGRHRPRVFFATALLGGLALTFVLGAVLTYYAPLPPTAVLGLAVLLGFALSIGIAALAWGTPARWRQYEDYTPGVHPRARVPLIIGISLLAGVAVAVAIGLADVDLFWGLLAGAFASGLTLLVLSGGHRKVAARRGEATLVPDLPDAMKPLILLPTWFLLSGVLFAVLTYALPGLVPVNALLSVLVGLGATFLALEQPLLKDMLAERREQRRRRKEWEARRKERLAAAASGADKPADAGESGATP